MKSSVYPTVIFASLLGLLGLVMLWLEITVSIETNSESSSLPEALPLKPQASSNQPLSTIASVTTPVSKSTEPVKQKTPPVSSSEPAGVATGEGTLRMSNQTELPVRVAMLARRAVNSGESSYGNPAHWDFAPGEGSQQGLILSLPESNLKLKKGDILVAFAQDGSRRYWGPYVVGETPLPTWNQQSAEWLLVLEP